MSNSKENILTSAELRIRNKEQFENASSLYAPVEKIANLLPNAVALRFMGMNISYGTLQKEVSRYAKALQSAGIQEGEAVTAVLPNIPESVYLLYAVSKANLRFAPLHPLTPPDGIRTAMEKSGSRIAFVLGDAAQKTAETCPFAAVIAVSPAQSLKIKRFLYSLKNPLPKPNKNLLRLQDFLKNPHGVTVPEQQKVCPAGQDTAILLQSGGTTGTPKVIGLSATAVNSLAKKGLDILGRQKVTDCGMLSVLPVFHGFGLAMGVHAMLCHGGKNVLFPKFHRASAVKEILCGNVQFIIGVPRLYEALLSHPKFAGDKLQSLVVGFVGGDFVPHTLLKAFDKRIAEGGGSCRLFEGYGLTETVTVCSVNTYAANKNETVGKPLNGISVSAFDFSVNPPAEFPADKKGELAVTGDTLMSEYLSDPEATEKVFFTHNGKRYVRTGDFGFVDCDGYVHFISRIKRIIKVRGIPVYPLEIEQLVSAQNGVSGVCAVPVSSPSGEEQLILFVESSDSDLPERLNTIIREKLSEFAVPSEIIVIPCFPYTNVSKIDTAALLKLRANS